MSDPFEDPHAWYYALVNDQDQYCLWPCSITVPEGWDITHGPDERGACVEHIDHHWTDIRPARGRPCPRKGGTDTGGQGR